MRIRPVETSGLPIPFQRRGQGPVIVGSPDPLAWANKADGAKHAWDFIANAARWNGQYIGALANTPNWTFSRASTAYYRNASGLLTSVASGVLRTGDRGALIEGAGTNLCLQSQTFDNASWSKSNVTVTADQAAAPDGTTTADKVEGAAGAAGGAQIYQTWAATATAFTYSVYIKKGSGATDCNKIVVRNQTTTTTLIAVNINLDTGALAYDTGASGASVTTLANGWYRVSIVISSGVTVTDSMRVYAGFTGAAETPGEYSYLWGAQLEATAFASSYVATTTASATRAADSLTVTGVTGLAYPLTLYVEAEPSSATGASQELLQLDDSTSNERAILRRNSAGPAIAVSVAGGVTQATPTSAANMNVGTVYKFASRFATDSVRLALNGTLATEDTSATNPATPSVIRFGAAVGGGSPGYTYIRRAAIYASAKTDAQLTALTT